jgi:hypothetical protein
MYASSLLDDDGFLSSHVVRGTETDLHKRTLCPELKVFCQYRSVKEHRFSGQNELPSNSCVLRKVSVEDSDVDHDR